MSNRCLYIANFKEFLDQDHFAILGMLHNNYHISDEEFYSVKKLKIRIINVIKR